MLPTANCSFAIPSLNDSLELHCRLYFPRWASFGDGISVPGFAILAHPYAPLGGCYDDPVVHTVGSIFLRHGIILCTFNFRGAAGSGGNTSWTGKAELADYVSVFTFVLRLIDHLDTADHPLLEEKPLLILGGYSYGSMIASHLPDLVTLQVSSADPSQEGTTDHDIARKAHEIAGVLLDSINSQTDLARNDASQEDVTLSPASRQEVVIGGDRMSNKNRRSSHDVSNWGRDKVRHSIDRVKKGFAMKGEMANHRRHNINSASKDTMHTSFKIHPTIAYLLISPLLYPVAGFTTIFSHLIFERKGGTGVARQELSISENLSLNPTLAIYGDKDMFTSARKLRKWAHSLESTADSHFSPVEIAGAGHFWHEPGTIDRLRGVVSKWITALQDRDRWEPQVA